MFKQLMIVTLLYFAIAVCDKSLAITVDVHRCPPMTFDDFDLDKNSYISVDEWKNVACKAFHDRTLIKLILKEMDENHNGKVSRGEFEHHIDLLKPLGIVSK